MPIFFLSIACSISSSMHSVPPSCTACSAAILMIFPISAPLFHGFSCYYDGSMLLSWTILSRFSCPISVRPCRSGKARHDFAKSTCTLQGPVKTLQEIGGANYCYEVVWLESIFFSQDLVEGLSRQAFLSLWWLTTYRIDFVYKDNARVLALATRTALVLALHRFVIAFLLIPSTAVEKSYSSLSCYHLY